MSAIIQLYPPTGGESSLEGLYLGHHLRESGANKGEAFVYTNYVVSLDGRIAIPHPTKDGLAVPQAIANDRDWRLFQELATQADVLITTGRYFRDYADGRAQEILEVYDDPKYADLKAWREANKLPTQPALAVISNSLNFEIPAGLTENGRQIYIFTSADADAKRIAELEQQQAIVLVAGDDGVDGRQMVRLLSERGHRTIYSTAGPKVFHLLLQADVLDRLYLTHAPRILGGDPFATIVEGSLLQPAADFKLHTLYFDAQGVDGLGQLFISYNRTIAN